MKYVLLNDYLSTLLAVIDPNDSEVLYRRNLSGDMTPQQLTVKITDSLADTISPQATCAQLGIPESNAESISKWRNRVIHDPSLVGKFVNWELCTPHNNVYIDYDTYENIRTHTKVYDEMCQQTLDDNARFHTNALSEHGGMWYEGYRAIVYPSGHPGERFDVLTVRGDILTADCPFQHELTTQQFTFVTQ